MIHAEETVRLARPAGTPPSECDGILEPIAVGPDSAQAGEGGPGDPVQVYLYRCQVCGSVLAISSAGRLRNTYVPPSVQSWRPIGAT